MSKFAAFEITVKMKELEIHVKGDREVAPDIASNVAHQISGVFQPSGLLEPPKEPHDSNPVITASSTQTRKPRRPRSSRTVDDGADGNGTVNWNHDANKWGTPVQTWKQWEKIMWVLTVVEAEAGRGNGLTTAEMTEIFRQKFRASGLLLKGNISRDLAGKSEYFGSVDDLWFLKESGKAEATRLVAEAKGPKASSASA